MYLTATDQSIFANTSSADAIAYAAAYADHDAAASSLTPGSSQGSIASATDTSLIGVPGSGVQRQVKELTLRNTGTGLNTVTLNKDVNGTKYPVTPAVALYPGYSMRYRDGGHRPFAVYDADERPLESLIQNVTGPFMTQGPSFTPSSLGAAKTATSGFLFALYMGKAPRTLTSLSLRCNVTTAVATITYAELAIAKGLATGAGPIIRIVGYTDVSATFNSTGRKSTTISVAAGQTLDAEDDMWAIYSNTATTAAAFRAVTQADDIQAGYQGFGSPGQPSTLIGLPTALSIESASTQAIWFTLFAA